MSASPLDLSTADTQLPAARANQRSLIFGALGVLGLAGSLVGIFGEASRTQALSGYLVAFMFVVTLAVGGMFFALLQHLVFARWSVAVRRIAENFGATTWLLVPLFIPIALFAKEIFPWWPGHVFNNAEYQQAVEHILPEKEAYLNPTRFWAFAVVYLGSWVFLGYMFRKRSVAVDKTGDVGQILALRKMAPLGVLVFALTLTFAGFDWMMSLEPTWYSTMFGVYTFAGSMLSSLALIALTGCLLQSNGYLKNVLNEEHFHDLGKLIFGFIVFWAYIAFSQFFLIWYANIPEETVWYRRHYEGGWSSVTWALVFGHFAIPFFAILSRFAKRNAVLESTVAALLIGMHYVDLYWVITPLFRPEFGFVWTDAAALVGLTGLFLAVASRNFGSAALVPIKDPHLADSLEYDNG
jgi:hypothetical protein